MSWCDLTNHKALKKKRQEAPNRQNEDPPCWQFCDFCSECGGREEGETGVMDGTFLFSQGVKRDIAHLPQSSGLLVFTSWGQV